MSNKREPKHPLGIKPYISDKVQEWLNSECSTKTGQSNVWECETCHWKLATIHRDTGVTPMFLAHMPDYGGDPLCAGEMVSWGYPVSNLIAIPQGSETYEWFRPTQKEFEKFSEPMKAYLRDGGLALRKINA